MPITTGLTDYPSGTITITWSLDGAAQPTMTMVFDGDSTANFTYNGTTTSITIYPASVD
jgi:hypothetical protein